MIIVSQNKKNIYNFDNVKSIDIVGNEIYISDDILSDMGTCIANYKTEERAKEVLREIYCRYEHSQSLLSSNCITVQDFMGKDFIYEMPEE